MCMPQQGLELDATSIVQRLELEMWEFRQSRVRTLHFDVTLNIFFNLKFLFPPASHSLSSTLDLAAH